MLFNSLQYFIFLPIVVLGYYVLPKKCISIWLLVVSYFFYMQWNPVYITLLLTSTLLTYVAGRLIDRQQLISSMGGGVIIRGHLAARAIRS